MATRAVYCSSHNTPQMPSSSHRVSDTGALRATFSSSHSSSNESLESGRERRRRGKNKMLQRIAELESQLSGTRQDLAARMHDLEGFQSQLAAATTRVSDLEQRNHCLSCLVDELTLRLKTEPPATLFDVFDLAEETTAVGCQTNISIDWSKPDRFFIVDAHGQLQALESSPSDQPVEPDVFLTPPLDQPAPSTSTADAAAGTAHAVGEPATESYQAWSGNGMATPRCLHTTLDGLRDSITDPQYHAWSGKGMATTGCLQATSTRLRISITDSTSDVGTWQAPDGDNSRHQVGDIATTALPVRTQCGPLPLDFNSQNLASHSELFVENQRRPLLPEQTLCGPLPFVPRATQPGCAHLGHDARTGARQALDDPNAEHRATSPTSLESRDVCGPLPLGYNSQDLANATGMLEVDTFSCAQSAHAPHQHTRVLQKVFNSQNLAFSASFQQRDQSTDQCSRQAHDVHNAMHREPGSAALAVDFTSQGLVTSTVDDLGQPRSEQSRTAHGYPNLRQELDADTSKHRGSGPGQCTRQQLSNEFAKHGVSFSSDFNSQDLALSVAGPCAFGDLESPRPHLNEQTDQSAWQEHDAATAMHRDSGPADFDSQYLAHAAEPFALQLDEQQAGAQAPQGTQQEHVEANAKDRVSDQTDFKSQSLATSAFDDPAQASDACNLASSVNLSLSFGPSTSEEPMPQAFLNIFEAILQVFCNRRKPTKNQIADTARAVVRNAISHGVSKTACCKAVGQRSMSLCSAVADGWPAP